MTTGGSFDVVLAAASRGDQRALEELYRGLARGVLGYLRGHGAAEAEDLASETFVAMVRQLPRFRGDERSFRSWVFAIAHRRLLDERRRLSRRREHAVSPEELVGTLADRSTGDAEQEALSRLGTRWAHRAIAGLTLDQRAVLLLRVLADLSVEEVASALGKSRGAVKALQRRALLTLARQIDREGVS
ncbi:MAG: RNA polymerase sigma factor [Actinomycetota bacterium]